MTKRQVGVALFGGALLIAAVGLYLLMRSQATDDSGMPRIGVVLPSDRNPFWIEVRRGAELAAQELGESATVSVTASNDQDATSQNAILDNLYARRAVDALVIGPANDHVTVPKVAKFLRDQIPVVVIDTELDSSALRQEGVKPTAFIGSSNRDGGQKAAVEMARALEARQLSRRVLLIQGSFVHQSAIDRTEGFLEVAGDLGLEVEQVKGEWRRDRAQELVSTRLSREDFGGIFANNDDMALGAVAALKGLDLKDDAWPVVIGFDATDVALDAIEKGEMYATVQQDALAMGKEGVLTAFQALSNAPLAEEKRLLGVRVVPER